MITLAINTWMLLGHLMGFPGVSWDFMGFTMEKTSSWNHHPLRGTEGREALTPAGGSELPPMPGPMGDSSPPMDFSLAIWVLKILVPMTHRFLIMFSRKTHPAIGSWSFWAIAIFQDMETSMKIRRLGWNIGDSLRMWIQSPMTNDSGMWASK